MSNRIDLDPGSKRCAHTQERQVRARQGSTEQPPSLASVERMPEEMWELVASYLQGDDLKNLSNFLPNSQRPALIVKNIQEMHAAVNELKELAVLNPLKPNKVCSAIDVYQQLIADIRNPDNLESDPELATSQSAVAQLNLQLLALSTEEVKTKFSNLRKDFYQEITQKKSTFDHIEQTYSRLKYDCVLQALNEVIASSIDPLFTRGWLVEKSAAYGHLEIVLGLSEHPTFSQDDRGRAVTEAAEFGHLKIVEALLKKPGKIDVFDKGLAIRRAAANGHLEIVQALLADGGALVHFVGDAIKEAAERGYLPIVKALYASGGISKKYIRLAKQRAVQKGHTEILDFFKSSQV